MWKHQGEEVSLWQFLGKCWAPFAKGPTQRIKSSLTTGELRDCIPDAGFELLENSKTMVDQSGYRYQGWKEEAVHSDLIPTWGRLRPEKKKQVHWEDSSVKPTTEC
jgi:hypothetical protein